MTTIEKLQQLRDYMNAPPFPKLEFSKACDEAIKALEDKEKYEAALKLMADDYIINCTRRCPLYGKCSYQGLQNCTNNISNYYKNKAGLEAK